MDQDLRALERTALAQPTDEPTVGSYSRELDRVGDRWRRRAGLSALARAGSAQAAALLDSRRTSPPPAPSKRRLPHARIEEELRRARAGSDFACVLVQEYAPRTHFASVQERSSTVLLCLGRDLRERWRRVMPDDASFECVEDRVLVVSPSEVALLDAESGRVVDSAPGLESGDWSLAGDRLLLQRSGALERVVVGAQGLGPPQRWEVRGRARSVSARGALALVTTTDGVAAHCLETGAELWWRSTAPRRTPAPGQETYRSPHVVDGATVVLQARGPKNTRVEVCDAATGEELWDAPHGQALLVVPVDAERLACWTGTSVVLRARTTGQKLCAWRLPIESVTPCGGALLGLEARKRESIVATRLEDGATLWRKALPFEREPCTVELLVLDDALLVVANSWEDHELTFDVARMDV